MNASPNAVANRAPFRTESSLMRVMNPIPPAPRPAVIRYATYRCQISVAIAAMARPIAIRIDPATIITRQPSRSTPTPTRIASSA